MGTLRARPSALNARALGVPSWGPLQQIQVPGGRFQPWGPRQGTPRIRAPTADRGGLGVGPLAPLRPALCRQLHPWGSPGRDPPSPTVQSGLGGSGGGSPPRARPSRADWGVQGVGPPREGPPEADRPERIEQGDGRQVWRLAPLA